MRRVSPLLALKFGPLAVIILLSMAGKCVSALALGDVTNDRATLDFPNTITFHVEIASPVIARGFVPVSAPQPDLTPTPLNVPTPASADSSRSGPPLSLTLMLAFSCCAIGLVVGVLLIAAVLATHNQQGGKNEKRA